MRSMRTFFAVVALGVLLSSAVVQTSHAQVMKKGSSILDVGLGLGYALSPFVTYEYGITDKVGPGYIGVGGSASLAFWSGGTAFSIGPEANYHFDFGTFPPKNLDLYLGLGIYYYNWFGNTSNYIPIDWSGHIGGRYFFTDKFGITLRLGGGINGAGGRVGLSIKL